MFAETRFLLRYHAYQQSRHKTAVGRCHTKQLTTASSYGELPLILAWCPMHAQARALKHEHEHEPSYLTQIPQDPQNPQSPVCNLWSIAADSAVPAITTKAACSLSVCTCRMQFVCVHLPHAA